MGHIKTVAERLKWAREQKGWSQTQLAVSAGVIFSQLASLRDNGMSPAQVFDLFWLIGWSMAAHSSSTHRQPVNARHPCYGAVTGHQAKNFA